MSADGRKTNLGTKATTLHIIIFEITSSLIVGKKVRIETYVFNARHLEIHQKVIYYHNYKHTETQKKKRQRKRETFLSSVLPLVLI